MKLVPMEPKWISPDAKSLFDAIAAERDRIVQQMMAEIDPPVTETSTAMSVLRRSYKSRYEIEAAYRPLLDDFSHKLAKMIGTYTVPQAMIIEAETEK